MLNNATLRTGNDAETIEDLTDLDTLADEHGLDRMALSYLAHCARGRGATRQQLPGLLRQACSRLIRVRDDIANAVGSEQFSDEIFAKLASAHEALQAGERFALERADQLLGEANACALEHQAARPEFIATLLACRAELAAIRQQHQRAADFFAQAATTPGLPEDSQWRYQHARARVIDELGRTYGDDAALAESADLLENRVLPLVSRSERPRAWSETQHSLGDVLGLLGQRGRGVRHLELAVTAFEHALSERNPEHEPLDWAASQHGLGNALGILAQRKGDTDTLERAVAALEAAVDVYSGQKASFERTRSAHHLGTALLTLAQVTQDSNILPRSIDAFRLALQEWNRELTPLDWAVSQNALGIALRAHGEQQGDARELEQAVAAHRSALTVWTREHWPEEWSTAQNNLGAALQKLGDHTNDTGHLRASVSAYQKALQSLHRDHDPIAWAMTRANLGDASRGLAERAGDYDMARRAVADFEAVEEVFLQACHARYYELAKERLVEARQLAAELAN